MFQLTHVADSGLLLSSTDKLMFNDASQFIQGVSATVLDIAATDEIELTSTLIDVVGNLAVSGTIVGAGALTAATSITVGSAVLTEAELETLDGVTVGTAIASKVVTTDANIDTTGQRNLTITGELDAATGDFSGDVDIDGTANLDTVDIDGATQIDATVTVGVDDTGYDVKFFGDTSGAHMLWDASVDDLILAGAGRVVVPEGNLVLGSTAVTSTPAEINLIDGGATVGTTAVADGDGLLHNDNGTMRVTSAATFKTYFQEGISTAYDDLTTGDAAVLITTSSGNITIDAAANDSDIILKGTDGGADTTFLTIDGSAAGEATFNAGVIAPALTIDDVAVDGKVITMTGSSGDTFVTTVAANGATSLVTTDAAAAAAHLQITADGTVDIDSAGVLTLDSGAAINIEPAAGSAILLDGTISVDAGVVTGATSITSTAFVGGLTGNVTGNASGTALTVTQAAQSAITSVGTLTALTVDNLTINGNTMSSSSGNIEFDSAGDIYFDAGGADWYFNDDTTEIFAIHNVSGDVKLDVNVQDKDMIFRGNDGGASVTALTLDMSAAGAATFNSTVFTPAIEVEASTPTIKIKGTVNDSANSGKIIFRENDDTNGFDVGYDGSANKFFINSNDVSPVFTIVRTTGQFHHFTTTAAPSGSFEGSIDGGKVYVNITNGFTADSSTDEFAGQNFNMGNSSVAMYGYKVDDGQSGAARDAGLQFWTQDSNSLVNRFQISNNGTLLGQDTSIGSLSDQRLKENIADLTYSLDTFKALKPKTFTWKNTAEHPGDGTRRGFIAQDLVGVDDYWTEQHSAVKMDDQVLEAATYYEEGDSLPSGKNIGDVKTAETYTYQYASGDGSDYDLLDDGSALANKFLAAKLGKKDAMYVSVIKQLITKIETLETKVQALEDA